MNRPARLPEQARVDTLLAAENASWPRNVGVPVYTNCPKASLQRAGQARRAAQSQRQVQVRYVGKLPDGTVFDQNEKPQWFKLGSVIEGWQVALPECRRAKWRLVIPSAQAYGAEGAGDLIAPYTPGVRDRTAGGGD
jgi:FKBP-type peptidyl-prolyl cis-trans isomerase